MRFRIRASVVLALALTACAEDPAAPAAGAALPPAPLAVGTEVAGPDLGLYGKRVPLPPGRWVVASTMMGWSESPRAADPNTPLTVVVLLNRDPDSANYAVSVMTNAPKVHDGGWTLSHWCHMASHVYRVVNKAVEGGDQECWWIAWKMTSRTRTSDAWKQAYAFGDSAGIAKPLWVDSVGYYLANSEDTLQLHYRFVRGRGDRNVELRDLKRWAKDWLPKVQAGLRGRM